MGRLCAIKIRRCECWSKGSNNNNNNIIILLNKSNNKIKLLNHILQKALINTCFNPLYAGNPLMSTLASSEDQDEMPLKTEYHQSIRRCFLR